MRHCLVVFVIIIMSCLLQPVYAISPPSSMTYLEWRPVSDGVVTGSFEASTRQLWRSGKHYYRMDEAADPAQQLHLSMIARARDLWFWNKYSNTAQHAVDHATNFDMHAPIFSWAKAPLNGIEFGEETQFFQQHAAQALADTVIDGVSVTVQSISMNSETLMLYSRKSDNTPFQIVYKSDQQFEKIRYDRYNTALPFDPSLFTLPDGITVLDMPASAESGTPVK